MDCIKLSQIFCMSILSAQFSDLHTSTYDFEIFFIFALLGGILLFANVSKCMWLIH